MKGLRILRFGYSRSECKLTNNLMPIFNGRGGSGGSGGSLPNPIPTATVTTLTLGNVIPPATNVISASAIDWALAFTHSKTLAANTTFTFSNVVDGKTIIVAVTNTASNYTVTWPTVDWGADGTPVQSVGAKTDIYTFVRIGSVTYGNRRASA